MKRISEKQRVMILAESMKENCTIYEVAKKYGITPSKLYSWRNKHFKEMQNNNGNNIFVEAKVTDSENTTTNRLSIDSFNTLKKVCVEFSEFKISIEGNFTPKQLEQIIFVGQKNVKI